MSEWVSVRYTHTKPTIARAGREQKKNWLRRHTHTVIKSNNNGSRPPRYYVHICFKAFLYQRTPHTCVVFTRKPIKQRVVSARVGVNLHWAGLINSDRPPDGKWERKGSCFMNSKKYLWAKHTASGKCNRAPCSHAFAFAGVRARIWSNEDQYASPLCHNTFANITDSVLFCKYAQLEF